MNDAYKILSYHRSLGLIFYGAYIHNSFNSLFTIDFR
jgi:hypothetical protein